MVHHQVAVFDHFCRIFKRSNTVCILCISLINALISDPAVPAPLFTHYCLAGDLSPTHTHTHTHTHTPYRAASCVCIETFYSHHGELLESKLKSFGVVGDALGFDVLDGVLQQLLVPDVGPDQVVEAAGFHHLHDGVELEGKPVNRRRRVLSLLVSSCVLYVKHLGCLQKRWMDCYYYY